MKESTRGREKKLKDQRFPVSLRGSWFGLNRNFRDLLADKLITPVQYTTLRNIYEFEGLNLNQKKLSILLSSNQNNLTAILKKLEVQELIDRRQGKMDGRTKEIEVTPLGVQVFQETQAIALGLQSKVMEVFSEEEANRLMNYLKKCSENLDLVEQGCKVFDTE